MLEEAARKIESMEIRGAGEIARAAARALAEEAGEFQGDLEGFRRAMQQGRERLLDTRPTAVSLDNSVRYVLAGIDDADSLKEAREGVTKRAGNFVEASEEAVRLIGEYGSRRLPDGGTVLTHCHSSAALAAVKKAHEGGKEIEVIATETRPRMQGRIVARELANAGVPVSLVVDGAARLLIREADAVMMGADTVASNGAVVNKIGSSMVALCADEARVPVTICAETYKFSSDTLHGDMVEIEERDPSEVADPRGFPGVDIRNPAFDATPPKYIDTVVTEQGLISPHEARDIIEEFLEV